jgi:transcriptional regulator with XRE-family HTH domain
MQDLQIGRAARALRHRLGVRQVDVADLIGVGHDVISRRERGRIDGLTVRTLRKVFAAFDAEIVVIVRWRGGELDRILDRRHAGLGELVVARLERPGWTVVPEVSFSHSGERGSIDLLAWHAATRTLLVIELKTELTSIEETLRRHDVKARLAGAVAKERLGWEPGQVARLLVLPDERTPLRQVDRFARVLIGAYPDRGPAVREWLAGPSRPISGLLFLTVADGARLRQRIGPTRRIAKSSSAAAATEHPSAAHLIGR